MRLLQYKTPAIIFYQLQLENWTLCTFFEHDSAIPDFNQKATLESGWFQLWYIFV